VRLPLASATPTVQPDEDRTDLEIVGRVPLRVLIIEDNDDGRSMLETLVQSWGHQTLSASDGIQGLTKALAERPDAALVDIGLPGLDGFDVARHIREDVASPRMMLIAMTGFGQPEDRRRAADAGFDTYMVKPIDADGLKRQLERIKPASAAPRSDER
jgi:CheY-like chemotaxis protein